MLKLRDLKSLPFTTLSLIVQSLAAGIDAGDDNHALLEQVFKIIASVS
jgi:hypothetical protein